MKVCRTLLQASRQVAIRKSMLRRMISLGLKKKDAETSRTLIVYGGILLVRIDSTLSYRGDKELPF